MFFCKGQVVTILLLLSVATTQLCGFDLKADIDNMQMNGCDCVTIKLYLLKQGEGPQLAGLCFKGWVSFYQLEKQRSHRHREKLYKCVYNKNKTFFKEKLDERYMENGTRKTSWRQTVKGFEGWRLPYWKWEAIKSLLFSPLNGVTTWWNLCFNIINAVVV